MSTEKIIVRNPATLEQIAELPVAQTADVEAAVQRGRKAQASWQQTSFAERARVLYRLRDLLLDEGDKLGFTAAMPAFCAASTASYSSTKRGLGLAPTIRYTLGSTDSHRPAESRSLWHRTFLSL